MKKFRIYVVGSDTYLTIEHAAGSVEDLHSTARDAGFVSAAAMERNGRKRNVLIPFGSVALIAEGEDQGPRARPAALAGPRRLS